MRVARLADVLTESRSGFWGSDPGSADVDVRVVRNGDIQEEGVRWKALPLRGVTHSEAARAALRKDDILITTSGDCGYSAHLQDDPEQPTIASNFVRILRFDATHVVPRYLYYYIQSQAFRSRLAPYIRGTTLKNLSLATAADHIDVPLPAKDSQIRVAEILDKADTLRAKRGAAVAQLDTLNQSIFLDMFGDPVKNPRKLRQVPLASLVRDNDRINYGVVQPGDDVDDGVPLIRVSDLRDGKVNRRNIKRIAPSIEAAYKRSRLCGDEILVSCVGSVGVVCMADESVRGFNIARAVARIPLAVTNDRVYIAEYLRTDFVQRYFTNELRTVSQPTLNIKQLAETPVLFPSSEERQEFARRIQCLERLKEQVHTYYAEMDRLFNSLQHRAFRGEL